MDNIRNGRFKTGMTDEAAEYTSSLEFDKIIFEADIKTNFAHTSMLKHEGIVDEEIADKILCALDELKEEGYSALVFDPSVEDVHMAIENYVTSKIGPEAGFMHTAKSRNDQVATDIRLVLREKISEIQIPTDLIANDSSKLNTYTQTLLEKLDGNSVNEGKGPGTVNEVGESEVEGEALKDIHGNVTQDQKYDATKLWLYL